ncbi:MAG: glycosyltransferase family 2 protein [Anaerolineales bacterium]|nr:glycosyltransferase family 2 protein [Anaerolineales bacterium]MCB0018951.1 glycosyltransferase family 2 protein [Anaerolineales bacterium]
MNVQVVIPALNEAGNIGPLVTALLAQPVNGVIVADNGSTDETAARAAAAGAVVVSEPRRGYGFACRAGSQAALAAGADLIVYIDGDYSSLPEELPRLLAPLAAAEADLVLGSRLMGQIAPGAMAPHQRFGNWLASGLMRRLYDLPVTDLSPYRAIRAELYSALALREMTFGWPTEMMVKAAKRRARLVEVPVTWAVRRTGRSKVSGTLRGTILAAYYILGVTLRYALWE